MTSSKRTGTTGTSTGSRSHWRKCLRHKTNLTCCYETSETMLAWAASLRFAAAQILNQLECSNIIYDRDWSWADEWVQDGRGSKVHGRCRMHVVEWMMLYELHRSLCFRWKADIESVLDSDISWWQHGVNTASPWITCNGSMQSPALSMNEQTTNDRTWWYIL